MFDFDYISATISISGIMFGLSLLSAALYASDRIQVKCESALMNANNR